ncbi:MAG: V-type ATPase subunit [Lachnospiraceae bacterium]|nr:V-type ATPase subunit [Lachnospiraceae bacterium]
MVRQYHEVYSKDVRRMQGMFAYSAVAAKMKAMTGRLVKKQEYEEMAALGSVAEVVNYLKRYPSYQKIFAGESEFDIHRGRVEALFQKAIYADFAKIYAFSGLEQRKFLDIYYIRYEIAILKNCLRMLFDHRDVTLDLSEFQTFFEKRSALDVMKLADSKSITEFVENLRGSIFFPPLKKLEGVSDATLFDYENALNLFYLKRMWNEFAKVMKNKDLKVIREIYGSEIELLNLEWIYRAKKYYHMSPADIYAFIVPVHYKLHIDLFRQIVEAPTIEEMGKLLSNCYYARFKERMDSTSIERMYEELIEKIHKNSSRKYPYSIICIETYLYKKAKEVDKLTTLIECVRYGLSIEDTKNYIA